MVDPRDDLPAVREVIKRYVADAELPQSPLVQSILKNDLRRVILRYDGERRIGFVRDVLLILSATARVPPECWGSPKAVANWVYAGGQHGRQRVLNEMHGGGQ